MLDCQPIFFIYSSQKIVKTQMKILHRKNELRLIKKRQTHSILWARSVCILLVVI